MSNRILAKIVQLIQNDKRAATILSAKLSEVYEEYSKDFSWLEILEKASAEVLVNSEWQHTLHKGKARYKLIMLVRMKDTLAPAVVYQSLDTRHCWVRPETEFFESFEPVD